MTRATGAHHPPAYLQTLKELVPKTEGILLEAQDHNQKPQRRHGNGNSTLPTDFPDSLSTI